MGNYGSPWPTNWSAKAALGEFLEWLWNMLGLAIASSCFIVVCVGVTGLMRDLLGRFCTVFGSCGSRFLRTSSAESPAATSPARLEVGAKLSAEEQDFIPSRRPLLHRIVMIIIAGGVVGQDSCKMDLQLFQGATVLEGIVIVLKYIFRGIAALPALFLLCICVGVIYVRLRLRQAALASALDELEPQTSQMKALVVESSQKGEFAHFGAVEGGSEVKCEGDVAKTVALVG